MPNNGFGENLVKKKSVLDRIKLELQRNKYLYILAIPVILYYVLFCYLPMFGLAIAFEDFSIAKGVFGSEWIGLKHFKDFFSGIYFTRTLKNTLIISFELIAFGFPIPIIFALLLNELNNKKLKKVAQTATYLPHFISMVVFCGIVSNFFGTDGLIVKLIEFFGGENRNYLADDKWFRPIFVFTDIWKGFGWQSIVYLAALVSVDTQLYEAATIDGANRFQKILHVSIPGILPTIMTMLILRLGHVLSIGYEKIILLASPGTLNVAEVISSYVYSAGIQGARYGYASAVGLFQSVVNIIFVLITNYISKKISETSIW